MEPRYRGQHYGGVSMRVGFRAGSDREWGHGRYCQSGVDIGYHGIAEQSGLHCLETRGNRAHEGNGDGVR